MLNFIIFSWRLLIIWYGLNFVLHNVFGKEDRGEDLSEGLRNNIDNNILSVGPLLRAYANMILSFGGC